MSGLLGLLTILGWVLGGLLMAGGIGILLFGAVYAANHRGRR